MKKMVVFALLIAAALAGCHHKKAADKPSGGSDMGSGSAMGSDMGSGSGSGGGSAM